MNRDGGGTRGILHHAGAAGHAPRGADEQRALELLATQPTLLEPGLVAVDHDLRLDDALWVDLLLTDTQGRPVVVLVGDRDLPTGLGRMAAVLAALVRNRWLIDRLYGRTGLDAFARPAFVLLASRYDDPVGPLLDLFEVADVRVLEMLSVVAADGTLSLAFRALDRGLDTRAATGGGRRPPSSVEDEHPATAEDGEAQRVTAELLADIEIPQASRDLFQRASDSICSLSSSVHVERDPRGLAFHVDHEVLAVLEPAGEGATVCVGANGGKRFELTDDASLHVCLNAVFGEYFNRFAKDD